MCVFLFYIYTFKVKTLNCTVRTQIRIFICPIYRRVSRDFWRPYFEANFKEVALYDRYKISVCTACAGYAIDQSIYPFTVVTLASKLDLQRFHIMLVYTVIQHFQSGVKWNLALKFYLLKKKRTIFVLHLFQDINVYHYILFVDLTVVTVSGSLILSRHFAIVSDRKYLIRFIPT